LEITNGVVVVANVHVTVQVPKAQVPVELVAPSFATTSRLLVSRSWRSEANALDETTLPVKFSVRFCKSADPAEFAVNVMFARLSTADFVRFVVLPRAVALGVSTVRRTVIWLPVAPPDTAALKFELAPNAVTVVVAIWKVDVVLSTFELLKEL
jgi:hypothetical protein